MGWNFHCVSYSSLLGKAQMRHLIPTSAQVQFRESLSEFTLLNLVSFRENAINNIGEVSEVTGMRCHLHEQHEVLKTFKGSRLLGGWYTTNFTTVMDQVHRSVLHRGRMNFDAALLMHYEADEIMQVWEHPSDALLMDLFCPSYHEVCAIKTNLFESGGSPQIKGSWFPSVPLSSLVFSPIILTALLAMWRLRLTLQPQGVHKNTERALI